MIVFIARTESGRRITSIVEVGGVDAETYAVTHLEEA
jgi:Flp pilus assembly CpaF family ATPase